MAQIDNHIDVQFVQNGHPLETSIVQNVQSLDVPCLQKSNTTEVPFEQNGHFKSGTIPKVQKRQVSETARLLNGHQTEVQNKPNGLGLAECYVQNGHVNSSEDLNSHSSEYCGEDAVDIPFNQG